MICLLSVFTPSIEEVWEVLTQRGSTRLFVGITFYFAAFPLHVKNFAIQDSNLYFVSCCSHSFYIKSDMTDKQRLIVVVYIHVSSHVAESYFPFLSRIINSTVSSTLSVKLCCFHCF